MQQTKIKLSVRDLVEYVLRCGDLVSSFAGSSRALAGTRAHKEIQKAQPAAYRAEVSLQHTVTIEEFVLEIGGRADGIIEDGEVVIIDEIKSTGSPLDEISETDNPLFWAQAECYAYIYAAQQALPVIGVQLTYYQLESKQTKRFLREYTFRDLTAFFTGLLNRYLDWARLIQQGQESRDRSISALSFPFDCFRAGQRDLSVAVYRTIASGSRLFAQAPTGIGKTIAVLFPAIKAMGERKLDKIFYLTAKTSTRDIAEKALTILRQKGLSLKSLTLTAKDKICFQAKADCNPEQCEYAKGHFDRVHSALQDIIEQPVFTRLAIEECARKHQVCPFEFSLDLALWADCVICDYNYVFDPQVCLKRFFADDTGRYCLLVDEAHNLPDRAREMYSASLAKKPVVELKRALKTAQPKLAKVLAPIQTYLNRRAKECEQQEGNRLVQKELPQEILPLLHRFLRLAEGYLEQNEPAPFREQLLQFYFDSHAFLRIAEEYDEKYAAFFEKTGGNVTGKLFCIDPSRLLRQILIAGRSAIFFSATLTPFDYFADMLGGDDSDGRISIPSPFPRQNVHILMADSISTTYKARTMSYDAVAQAIGTLAGVRTGNYLAFFPSYRYLDEVAARYIEQYGEAGLLCQSPGMTDAEREAFLACFVKQQAKTLVGFAVMGGAFGEGIDLTGEQLSGAVIVGVGLPQICPEREIIREYFGARQLGFEYGYLYPGMNKVLQAAGRVIRTDTDRGVILLVDERFAQPRCRRLLPEWWRPVRSVRSAEAISASVSAFWHGRHIKEQT